MGARRASSDDRLHALFQPFGAILLDLREVPRLDRRRSCARSNTRIHQLILADWYVNKPLGFSWFPKEITPVPRAWVETTGELVFWREHDKGGHFAAAERPKELWKDVEDFLDTDRVKEVLGPHKK